MNIEMTNAGNLFDTKSLNKKLTFQRKVKSKSIALVGGVI